MVSVPSDHGDVVGAGFPEPGEGRWVTLELKDVPYPVQIRVAKGSDGRMVCTGLRLGVLEGDHFTRVDEEELTAPWGGGGLSREWEITARSLRLISLPAILDYLLSLEDPPEPLRSIFREALGRESLVEDLAPQTVLKKRPGPQGHPREHWERVAAVYREGLLRRPGNPHKYVAERLYTTEQTSRRWVSKCRDLGLLGARQLGKAGEAPADEGPSRKSGQT